VEIFIDIRLSRSEAFASKTIFKGVSCRGLPHGKVSMHAFSWAFSGRTVAISRNHVPVSFSTKERKTEVERKSEHGPLPA
jgi:hypothetical protein